MTKSSNRVIIISNDVVPGMGVPVAAPGLRAHGLALGLRSHGYDVEVLVDNGPQQRVWTDDVPAPSSEHAVSLAPAHFMDYIATRAPVTVITTNSNQVAWLRRDDAVRYIVDFFAPKMLEHAHRKDDHDAAALANLRGRKLQAIELADGFVVNGRKKLPYFVAWLLQGSRDLRTLPIDVVNMAVPNHFVAEPTNDVVKFGMAGYLQGWSRPAAWIRSILDLVDDGRATFEVLAPTHWGQKGADLASSEMAEVFAHPGVTVHSAMALPDYQRFIGHLDVVLDVFDYSLEREYAMVTRTVSAIACGRPVVHPRFTEVSPIIAEFDAGWLVDADDPDGIGSVLDSVTTDRSEVERKAQNAREAWRQSFEPRTATQPLKRIIGAVWE